VIVTVTLNGALDRTLLAPQFRLGATQLATESLALAGGKGMNVARALTCQGVPVLVLGFAGGLVGEQMRLSLDQEGLPYDLTPISRESRICTAIIDPETGTATEVNEQGPAISEEEQHAFLSTFGRALLRARLVVLSGSLPAGLPDDFYAQLIARARSAGVPCLLDTRGAPLRAGVHAAPVLIKPNQSEAAQLLGSSVNLENAEQVRQALPAPGPALLCLTHGAAGAILHAPCGSWRAVPPSVQALDTVGAGDAFVSGLAAVLLRAMEARTAPAKSWTARADAAITEPGVVQAMLRQATAVAAASTLTLGAGRCSPAAIARLLPQVRIDPCLARADTAG
jgi:tagatose 6-phosphate kinase